MHQNSMFFSSVQGQGKLTFPRTDSSVAWNPGSPMKSQTTQSAISNVIV